MKRYIPISMIDITPYQSCPQLPTEGTLSLGQDLIDAQPPELPPYAVKLAKRLAATVAETEEALVIRVEEAAGIDLAAEGKFDTVLDRFWKATRGRVDYWQLHEQEGLELLDPSEQAEMKLEQKRKLAKAARDLDKHLFGVEGLDFTRRPYPQQATLMASRLEFIQTSEHREIYIEVLGEELFESLVVMQGRYEAMVRARSKRDASSLANLRELRHQLQRVILRYASGIVSMLDEDEPDSGAIVVDALQPMVNARVRRARGSVVEDEVAEDEVAEDEVAEDEVAEDVAE
jgi:hypothetical protein